MRPIKLIGGIPHRLVRCAKCKELIWMPVKPGNRDNGIICGTCLTDSGHRTNEAGGGRRVIRDGKTRS